MLEGKLQEIIDIVDKCNIKLTETERRGICSLGKQRLEYVEKLIQIAKEQNLNKDFISSQLQQLETMLSDAMEYSRLNHQIKELEKKISDRFLVLGNQIYNEARQFHRSLEYESIQRPEIKTALDKIKTTYNRGKNKTKRKKVKTK